MKNLTLSTGSCWVRFEVKFIGTLSDRAFSRVLEEYIRNCDYILINISCIVSNEMLYTKSNRELLIGM